MSPPPGQPPDLTELRPHRWKTRLIAWLIASVGLHLVAALVLWRSQAVRNWLFSSFQSKPPQIEDVDQFGRARTVFERLVRLRIIDANKRMLASSRIVLEKRTQEWKAVAERAKVNPNFRAMFDQGLPPLEILDSPGDPRQEDVLALYARARRLEEQVLALYEQFKALNLSLISVSGMQDGQPVPQPFTESLSLVKLERPERRELDRKLLLATDAELFAIKGKPATGAEPEQPDGYGRWRAEATSAIEMCEVMANNCQRIFQNVEKPGIFIDSGFASLPGAAAGGGPRWVEPNARYLGESLRPEDTVDSDLTSVDVNAVMTLGKHLGPEATSRPAKYLVLDTWWEIGPFDYFSGVRNQESLEYKYPPENGVDLDATYVGKAGRKLKWEYHPMSTVMQVPRFVQRCSLWYFYTEFHSDKEQEVWANIVSDDYGAVWLNSEPQPVYTSGTIARPWVPLDARQFVKLKLRKGTNRMLVKLDNQGGLTGFTVILCLK